MRIVAHLNDLQTRLNYRFQDVALLQLALTHPSVVPESAGNLHHNQRLEFLGDSVLGLVLTQQLYEKFPSLDEGPLTKARAQMVNRRTLADQARRLRLGELLVLSNGEESSGGRERQSSLADTFEAVLGAIFLDGGFAAARDVTLQCFRDAFGELDEIPNLENPKGELQEMLQEKQAEPPRYELTAVSGPDHDRVFASAVFHSGLELGRGQGKSKKAAESEAALAALQTLRKNKKVATP